MPSARRKLRWGGGIAYGAYQKLEPYAAKTLSYGSDFFARYRRNLRRGAVGYDTELKRLGVHVGVTYI
uniref:Uncharacterized protein n=1 Tax=Helianthus annuus TaxID=4232 RepID=A0A251UT92_HELAN